MITHPPANNSTIPKSRNRLSVLALNPVTSSPFSSSSERGVDKRGSTSCALARARSRPCEASSDFSGACGLEGRGKRCREGGGGGVHVRVRWSRRDCGSVGGSGSGSGELELETGDDEHDTTGDDRDESSAVAVAVAIAVAGRERI
jgi:hypothetical protein